MIGAVGGIFSTEILWPSMVESPSSEIPAKQVNKTKRVTVKENEALQDVIEETEPSVVAIKGEKNGTGFVLTSDGLVVTLSSITDGTSTVVYQGEELVGSLVKTGETFTTLQIDKDNLPTRGIAEEVQLGERVFLIGKLFNDEIITAVNHGIVKYFDQEEVYTNISESESLEGSPLLNIEGEVIGLVTVDEGKAIGAVLPEISKLIGN